MSLNSLRLGSRYGSSIGSVTVMHVVSGGQASSGAMTSWRISDACSTVRWVSPVDRYGLLAPHLDQSEVDCPLESALV